MNHGKFVLGCCLLLAACSGPAVEWTEGIKGADGHAQHTYTLKNMPGGSRLWFQELYDDDREMVEGPATQHYQGTTYYVDIPEEAPKTLTIKYSGRALPRHTWAPEGFVLQQKGKKDQPLTATYHYQAHPLATLEANFTGSGRNVEPGSLIPRPKNAQAPLPHPEGWYKITLQGGEAHIESEDRYGELYAQQTLSRLPQDRDLVVEDWPDLPYRGLMLDVVRDFRTKEEVERILDIMALYKLNRLHFHIADDEAWCLEIPKLPILTTFSGVHALPDWDLKETRALKPAANGRIDQTTFYTEAEYREILQYAWERGIAVVPEFDIPGHSRASIKAMQAYERETGDDSYRLQNPEDQSKYWSAQDFSDNVLDPEYPGVYKFYGVVFDEVIRMHKEAGVPLPAIHIGGDEVPNGVWAGRDRQALKDLFTNRMLDLAEERGVLLAGWHDLALNIRPETQERLKRSLYFLNAWSRNREAALTCRLANDGFPVLLCNVDNTYVDLAYSPDPEEIGLHWGGYVNERSTFSLQPWNLCDVPLEHPENVIGAQANLWGEKVRSLDDATYQLLPKALGVWERAWNSRTEWPTDEAFEEDFQQFCSIVQAVEKPLWDAAGYNYKKR